MKLYEFLDAKFGHLVTEETDWMSRDLLTWTKIRFFLWCLRDMKVKFKIMKYHFGELAQSVRSNARWCNLINERTSQIEIQKGSFWTSNPILYRRLTIYDISKWVINDDSIINDSKMMAVVYKSSKNSPDMTIMSLSISKLNNSNSQNEHENINFWACWPKVTS